MAKTFALIFGVVFLVVGILGYFPNPIVGESAFFHTDGVHNVVHLVSGVFFLLVAFFAPAYAAIGMMVFGVVYLLVAILGFIGMDPVLGFIYVNRADNFLHLALGVVIGLVGLMSGKKGQSGPTMM